MLTNSIGEFEMINQEEEKLHNYSQEHNKEKQELVSERQSQQLSTFNEHILAKEPSNQTRQFPAQQEIRKKEEQYEISYSQNQESELMSHINPHENKQEVYKIRTPHLSQGLSNEMHEHKHEINTATKDIDPLPYKRANYFRWFDSRGRVQSTEHTTEVYNVDSSSTTQSFSSENNSNMNDSSFASCDDGGDDVEVNDVNNINVINKSGSNYEQYYQNANNNNNNKNNHISNVNRLQHDSVSTSSSISGHDENENCLRANPINRRNEYNQLYDSSFSGSNNDNSRGINNNDGGSSSGTSSSNNTNSDNTNSNMTNDEYYNYDAQEHYPFVSSQLTKVDEIPTMKKVQEETKGQHYIPEYVMNEPNVENIHEIENDLPALQQNTSALFEDKFNNNNKNNKNQWLENTKRNNSTNDDNNNTAKPHEMDVWPAGLLPNMKCFTAEHNEIEEQHQQHQWQEQEVQRELFEQEEYEKEQEEEQQQKLQRQKEKEEEEKQQEQLAWFNAPIDTVGLINDGSTCYLNSLLQLLFHINYFRTALYKIPVQVKCNDDNSDSTSYTHKQAGERTSACANTIAMNSTGHDEAMNAIPNAIQTIHGALQELFVEMTERNSAASTRKLTQAFGWGERELTEQHDIQEMAALLRETLEEKMKNTVTEGVINELFEGHGESIVTTLDGSYVSKRKDVFCDIHLPLGEHTTLLDSLRSLTEREQLTGDNKYLVEGDDGKKGVYKDAEKYYTFNKFPPVIWFHLKRFAIDLTSPRLESRKVNSRLEFPVQLDLTDFETPSDDNDSSTNKEENYNDKDEDVANNPNNVKELIPSCAEQLCCESELLNEEEEEEEKQQQKHQKEAHLCETESERETKKLASQSSSGKQNSRAPFTRHSPAIYDLHGVIVHRGTVRSGHYYCYIREYNPQLQKFTRWIEFEDENVRVVNEEIAVENNFGGNRFSGNSIHNTNKGTISLLAGVNDYVNRDSSRQGGALNSNNNNNNNSNNNGGSDSNASAYMLSYVRRADTPTILAAFDSNVISPEIRNYVKSELEKEAKRKREEEEARAKITFIVITDQSLRNYCAEHQLEFFTNNVAEAKKYAMCVLEMKKTDLTIDVYHALHKYKEVLENETVSTTNKQEHLPQNTQLKLDASKNDYTNNNSTNPSNNSASVAHDAQTSKYLNWRLWRSPSRSPKWLSLDSHERCMEEYEQYKMQQQEQQEQEHHRRCNKDQADVNINKLYFNRHNNNNNNNNNNKSANESNYLQEKITIRKWLFDDEQNRPLELLLYVQTQPILFRPYLAYRNLNEDEQLFSVIAFTEPLLSTGILLYFQQMNVRRCFLNLKLFLANKEEPISADQEVTIENGHTYLRLVKPEEISQMRVRCAASGVLSITRIRVDLAACTLPAHCIQELESKEIIKSKKELEELPLLQHQELEQQEEEQEDKQELLQKKEELEECKSQRPNSEKEVLPLISPQKQPDLQPTLITSEQEEKTQMKIATSNEQIRFDSHMSIEFTPRPKTVLDVTEQNIANALLLFWKYYDSSEHKMKYLGSMMVDNRAILRSCEFMLSQMSHILPCIIQEEKQRMLQTAQKAKLNTSEAAERTVKTKEQEEQEEEEEKELESQRGKEEKSNVEQLDSEENINNNKKQLLFNVANVINNNWVFYEEHNSGLKKIEERAVRLEDTYLTNGSCMVVEYIGKLPQPHTSNQQKNVVRFYREIASLVKVYVTQIKRTLHDHHHEVGAILNTYYYNNNNNNNNMLPEHQCTQQKEQIHVVSNDNDDGSDGVQTQSKQLCNDATSISLETNSLTSTTARTNNTSHASNKEVNDGNASHNIQSDKSKLTLLTNPFSTNLPSLHSRKFDLIRTEVCCISKLLSYNNVCNTIAKEFQINPRNILLYPCSNHMDDFHSNNNNTDIDNDNNNSNNNNKNISNNSKESHYVETLEKPVTSPVTNSAQKTNSDNLHNDNNDNNDNNNNNNNNNSSNNNNDNNKQNETTSDKNNALQTISKNDDKNNTFLRPSHEAFSENFTSPDVKLNVMLDYNRTFTHHNRLFFELLPVSREKYMKYAPLTIMLRDAAGHAVIKDRFNITSKMCTEQQITHLILECAKHKVHPRSAINQQGSTTKTNKLNSTYANSHEEEVLYDPWNSLQETLSARHFLLLMIEPDAHVYRTVCEVSYNPEMLERHSNKYTSKTQPTSHDEENEESDSDIDNNDNNNINSCNSGIGGGGGNDKLDPIEVETNVISDEDNYDNNKTNKKSSFPTRTNNRKESHEVEKHNLTSQQREDFIHQSKMRKTHVLDHDLHFANEKNNDDKEEQEEEYNDNEQADDNNEEDDDSDDDNNDNDVFYNRRAKSQERKRRELRLIELQFFTLQGFEFEVIPVEPLRPGEQRITCCQGEILRGNDVRIFGNPFFITIDEFTTVTDAMELMLQRTHCSPSVLVSNPKLKVMMYTNICKNFND